MELNEAQTRSVLINQQLLSAGWKLSDRTQVGRNAADRFFTPAQLRAVMNLTVTLAAWPGLFCLTPC